MNRFPGVFLKSLSPLLFDRLRLEENDGKLTVPVTAIVPPELMGAGAGLTSEGGAICIQSMDTAALARHGLDKLRLGDVVAITDYDSSYGHGYKKGSVSLGVVSATDSIRAGYGPGVTLLMTSPGGELDPTDRRRDQHRQPARLRGARRDHRSTRDRPATVMGRAVSARAFTLADSLPSRTCAAAADEIDLTTPETLGVPEHVQAAAAAALDRGETHYTTRPGVIPLARSHCPASDRGWVPRLGRNGARHQWRRRGALHRPADAPGASRSEWSSPGRSRPTSSP